MLNFGNKEFRNLQEQVLKNAQDIETLKGRENLQIVIVEELPETGNPNYIYLVPNEEGEESNVYNEYIWLADEETYEQIGAVNIDLTNYVTLDTEQTISANKKISSNLYFGDNNARIYSNAGVLTLYGGSDGVLKINSLVECNTIRPNINDTYDLGTSSLKWKDIYLSGKAYFVDPNYAATNTWTMYATNQFNLILAKNGTNRFLFQNAQFSPADYQNPTCNLGSANYAWKDAYIMGNLSDGANSVTVANIASKVTSTFISGTFDSNGESTIDTEQEGTPEGLFIFTYGNCQCFLRLTAAMVNSADVTPIRVACPMIYNSGTVNGWLNIAKAGLILILKITDGTNHVDSGYAWTLTKTNLL